MRIATYNLRNGRAPDLASLWWTRRRSVVEVIRRIDADIWGLQEVYAFQQRHLGTRVFDAIEWGRVGEGRKGGAKGEHVPLVFRRSMFTEVAACTRWFGPTPETPGSRAEGARMPRIATVLDLEIAVTARTLRVVNLHLDSDSADRRAAAIRQLIGWLGDATGRPTIVMGDFNGPMTDPGFDSLTSAGFRSALVGDAGPTSNGFGRRLGDQRQIDHVFVSPDLEVVDAFVDVDAGHASDHYPVVVDLR